MSAPAHRGRAAARERALADLDRAARNDAALPLLLERAVHAFQPGRFALVSAFGPGSAVLIDALTELGLRIPVIFVDTLHHFPETLDHVERVRVIYDLDLRVYRPASTRAAFEARHGERLWERDLEAYQRLAKVEPFERATAALDGWLTGRRRDQSQSRAELPVVQPDPPVRINPLAAWTREQVWARIHARNLPYNPLHDLGYASIGDAPLTTPVSTAEGERAGRWRGDGRLECGIHDRRSAP